MPQAPYAAARATLNGGAVQTGGITAAGGAVVQLSADPAGLAGATQVRWELLDFPSAFTVPAGWSTDANGFYYSTAATPPPFTLLSSADWGKYIVRLTLNGGGPALTGRETAAQRLAIAALTDESFALSVESVDGLKDLAYYEKSQFGGIKGWVKDFKANLRQLQALIAGAGLGSGLVVSGSPAAGQVPVWNGVGAVWGDPDGNQINTFTQSTSLYEIGTVLANPSFGATYSAAPTALRLTNNQNSEDKNVLSTPAAPSSSQSYTFTLGYSVTFTLHYTNITTDTATLTKQAAQRNYAGVAPSGSSHAAMKAAATYNTLDTNGTFSFTVTSTGGSQRAFIDFPSRYGVPTVKDDDTGLGVGLTLLGTTSDTNAQGYAENYDRYEFDSAFVGTKTFNVTN